MTTLPNAHHPTSEDLFAYRDGELTAERRSLIEAHVLACVQCRERIDEMSAAESDLRRRPDPVGEEYFARMTESVMARIGSSAPVVAAREAEPAPVRPGVAGGGRLPGPVLSEVPPVERRRPDYTQVGDGEPRRRLRLPWIGVAGSAAAAVAVVVVAVILFQRQEEWLSAPRPAVVGESDQAAVPADSSQELLSGDAAGTRTGASGELQRGAPGRGDLRARVGSGAASVKNEATGRRAATTQEREVAFKQSGREEAVVTEPTAPMADAPRARQVGDAKLRAQQAPQASLQRGGEIAGSAPPTAGAVSAPESAPSEAYAGVLRGHGLPPVWNPAVTADAVLRAESDLRFVYQTGRAGADSARIRLYLAEAERARLDPSDTKAVESISHHYRRAISLSRGDAAVIAAARRRLGEFEAEMIRVRGTQP